jgi:hypothetical protein
VATVPPFTGGVDWRAVNPADYTDVVFVCGPMGNGWPIPELLARFAGARFIGINLTMLEALDVWNPFDVLLERDSSVTSRPDLALLAPSSTVPVVGVVQVHPQKEYTRGAHDAAKGAIERLIASRHVAAVPIDTRLDVNAGGLRTAAEVESLIARMDVIVTTRLHGLVLGLKNGIPVVAIDPIAGGAKLARQAATIGWPLCFEANADADELARAFDHCLTEEARAEARACATRARTQLLDVRERFLDALGLPAKTG